MFLSRASGESTIQDLITSSCSNNICNSLIILSPPPFFSLYFFSPPNFFSSRFSVRICVRDWSLWHEKSYPGFPLDKKWLLLFCIMFSIRSLRLSLLRSSSLYGDVILLQSFWKKKKSYSWISYDHIPYNVVLLSCNYVFSLKEFQQIEIIKLRNHYIRSSLVGWRENNWRF